MNTPIYIFQGSGQLKNYAAAIERNAWQAVKKIEKKILVSDVDIIFYDNPAGVIPELGIGGYSPNPHTVFISLDPSFSDFRQTVDIQIERILAHELNHCARASKIGYGKTLFEALVTEGGEYLKKHPDKKPSQIYDISADEFKVK